MPHVRLISSITEKLRQRCPVQCCHTSSVTKKKRLKANVLRRSCLRSDRHAEMEETLLVWAYHRLDHAIFTYALLQSQAAQLGVRLGVTNFTYSTDWVWQVCELTDMTVANVHLLAFRQWNLLGPHFSLSLPLKASCQN